LLLFSHRLVKGRERIYLDRFWNELSANPKTIDEATRRHYAKIYARPGAMHAAFNQFAASAIATFAPSRANTMAMSLPIPLAAPVMMATLSLRRIPCLPLASGQIVVNDLAEIEGEVGDDVRAGHDLENR
jgi:hypothetical protein